MSGNCATGMRRIDSTPASVIRMAMTIASRGRSTKTAEIMSACRRPRRGWRRCGRTGRHGDPGANFLDALQHDHVAVVEAAHDHRSRGRGLAELDAALLDL